MIRLPFCEWRRVGELALLFDDVPLQRACPWVLRREWQRWRQPLLIDGNDGRSTHE